MTMMTQVEFIMNASTRANTKALQSSMICIQPTISLKTLMKVHPGLYIM